MTIRKLLIKSGVSRPLVVGVIFAFAAQALPQDSRPDSLVEASVYAARARQEVGCASGEELARKALGTARHFRSASQTERDTAGAFVGEVQLLLNETRQRRKFLENESTEAAKLLSVNRLETARRRIVEANAPTCDHALQTQRDEIDARSTRARIRAAEATRMLQRDPKAALKLFEQVRNMNAEFPGIDFQIAEAKANAHHYHNWGGAVRKVFLYGIAITAAGVGAYFGYQEYRRSSMHNTAAR